MVDSVGPKTNATSSRKTSRFGISEGISSVGDGKTDGTSVKEKRRIDNTIGDVVDLNLLVLDVGANVKVKAIHASTNPRVSINIIENVGDVGSKLISCSGNGNAVPEGEENGSIGDLVDVKTRAEERLVLEAIAVIVSSTRSGSKQVPSRRSILHQSRRIGSLPLCIGKVGVTVEAPNKSKSTIISNKIRAYGSDINIEIHSSKEVVTDKSGRTGISGARDGSSLIAGPDSNILLGTNCSSELNIWVDLEIVLSVGKTVSTDENLLLNVATKRAWVNNASETRARA